MLQLRLQGCYTWTLLETADKSGTIVVIESDEGLDRDKLWADFTALEFVLGQPLLTGVDAQLRAVAADAPHLGIRHAAARYSRRRADVMSRGDARGVRAIVAATQVVIAKACCAERRQRAAPLAGQRTLFAIRARPPAGFGAMFSEIGGVGFLVHLTVSTRRGRELRCTCPPLPARVSSGRHGLRQARRGHC